MSPDSYAEAWRKADADYDRRERQRVADQVETLLREHEWRGGYYCNCGLVINMPASWGRHLLELALIDQQEAMP